MTNAQKLKLFKSLLSSRAEISKRYPPFWSSYEPDSWKSSSSARLVQTHRSNNENPSGGLFNNLSPRRPYFSNEDLNLMCPVSLHDKLAYNRYEVAECRCRKLTMPIVRDLEFDYFIRLLPTEQLVVVVVIDSQ